MTQFIRLRIGLNRDVLVNVSAIVRVDDRGADSMVTVRRASTLDELLVDEPFESLAARLSTIESGAAVTVVRPGDVVVLTSVLGLADSTKQRDLERLRKVGCDGVHLARGTQVLGVVSRAKADG